MATFAAALVLVVVAAAAAIALWLYLIERSSLPQMDGTLHVAGLSAPVTVRRDAHGVPHIEAATEDDLFFAQGYVTAQDRLWQMDMFRRHADGNLASILGPGLIEHDRMQRMLEIEKQAQRIYASLPLDDRRRLDDYARGVNALIAQREATGRLPAEFRILMYKPHPWTGTDSVSVGLMEVQELDMHAMTKLDRWYVSAKLNNPQLESDLYPVGSWRDHPPTGVDLDLSHPQPPPPPSSGDENDEDNQQSLNGSATANPATAQVVAGNASRYAQEALGRPLCEGCAVGSNEWVVAGTHTASGKPLLSNDMHIQLTEPNIWYVAGLQAPGFDAVGVTLPGVPFIVAGHNEHVAWGFTDLMADVQDLYFEKLDGKGNYLGNDGQWHPLSIDSEVIRVRGGHDVIVDVKSTDHGPLVNSLVGEPRAIALKWNLYDLVAAQHSAVRDGRGPELGGFFRGAGRLVLAGAESGLLRRSGPHCISRHRQGPAASGGAYGIAD